MEGFTLKYRIEIQQTGKIFNVRGKSVRSPLSIDNVTEEELPLFKSKIQLEGILENNYSIKPMSQVIQKNVVEKENDENSEVELEDQDEIHDPENEDDSVLGSLLKDGD